jgi:hypothetical protein
MNEQIAAVLAELQATKNARTELDRQSAKLKVKEASLQDQLIALDADTGVYDHYMLVVDQKPVPRVTDWATFYAYLKQSGNLDMLTKHLTNSAINARIEAGEYVPGVVVDTKPTFKITAV